MALLVDTPDSQDRARHQRKPALDQPNAQLLHWSQLAQPDKPEAFYAVDPGSKPGGGIAGRSTDRFVVGPPTCEGLVLALLQQDPRLC
eukprot:scaffold13592_cov17-Prasinocladus_malaysianus.AAC.2